MGRRGFSYNSGIGPQAGEFSTINEASHPGVKAAAKLLFSKVTFACNEAVSAPAQPLQHVRRGESVRRCPDRGLERAQRLAGLAAELAVRGAAVEAALHQKLLQFHPFGPRQHPFLPRPGLNQRSTANYPV